MSERARERDDGRSSFNHNDETGRVTLIGEEWKQREVTYESKPLKCWTDHK